MAQQSWLSLNSRVGRASCPTAGGKRLPPKPSHCRRCAGAPREYESRTVPLTTKERKALAASGNRLKATLTLAAGELSDATVAHVQQSFGKHELLKIRINTDDRDECASLAKSLADRIGAELVQVVGRTALLHRGGARQAPDESHDA